MISAGSRQLVEDCLCFPQIGRVEALGEPAVDRREEVAGFLVPTLLAPQPDEAHGGAQFPKLASCSWASQGFAIQFLGGLGMPLAAAATGLCAGSAPLRNSAPLSFPAIRKASSNKVKASPNLPCDLICAGQEGGIMGHPLPLRSRR